MRYTLVKNPIIFNYFLTGQILDIVLNYKDFGILFDSKLNFSNHTKMIKNKAMRTLGFINPCKSFHDPLVLKILYRSLFRSNLEYCLLIWTNNTIKHNDSIESV